MGSKIYKDAVIILTLILSAAVSDALVEVPSTAERVPCHSEPGHMSASVGSNRPVTLHGGSRPDTGASKSDTCSIQLIAKKAGILLLEMLAPSGLGRNLSSRVTLSQQRANGAVLFKNQISSGPFWLIPVEIGDKLSVTATGIASDGGQELRVSLITNSTCGDASQVHFSGACYSVRPVASVFAGAEDPACASLIQFAAHFSDEEQLRAFVQRAAMSYWNLTTPVLLGLTSCNGRLLKFPNCTSPGQQCRWTDFGGDPDSLERNSSATDGEQQQWLTLRVTQGGEPVLGLADRREAVQLAILLAFPASGRHLRDDNLASCGEACPKPQPDNRAAVIAGSCLAAAVVAAAVIVAVLVVNKRTRDSLTGWIRQACHHASCAADATADNSSSNNNENDDRTTSNNRASNGDAPDVNGPLLGPAGVQGESPV